MQTNAINFKHIWNPYFGVIMFVLKVGGRVSEKEAPLQSVIKCEWRQLQEPPACFQHHSLFWFYYGSNYDLARYQTPTQSQASKLAHVRGRLEVTNRTSTSSNRKH